MAPSLPKLSTRYPLWMLLTFCSVVALIGQATQLQTTLRHYSGDLRWCASVMAISFIFALTAVAAHHVEVSGRTFNESIVEGILAVLVFAFWVAGIPTIMDPHTGIAVGLVNGDEKDTVITSGNVYFASWLALITTVLILADYVKHAYNFESISKPDGRVLTWIVLALTSFIAMASAIRQYKINNCYGNGSHSCSRASFAAAVGVITGVIALIWVLTPAKKATPRETLIVTILLCIAWIFVVGFTTFGQNATAASPSNMFFSAWGGLIITGALVVDGLRTANALSHLESRLSRKGKTGEKEGTQNASATETNEKAELNEEVP